MPANFPTSLDGDGSLLVAKDFVRTTVRADMNNSQTNVPVNDASVFPDPAGAVHYTVIDADTSASREIVSFTGLDLTGGANRLTGVVRGLLGTTAVAHLTGVLVEQNIISRFHASLKEAIVAVETKVGIDASATTSTHDYKLSEVTSTDKSVGKTATQTLTNKTLTTPTIADLSNATHAHAAAASGGTVAHSVITGVTADQHHARLHDHSATADGQFVGTPMYWMDL